MPKIMPASLDKEVAEVYPDGVDPYIGKPTAFTKDGMLVMEDFADGIVTVDKLLDNIDLSLDWYIPSKHAIDFIVFIRLVLGEEPENSNPKAHYFFVDCIFEQPNVVPFFMARGMKFEDMAGRLAILASREFSKALCMDTKIATPNGYTTMGDLSVGDEVITRDGKPTKILKKSKMFYGLNHNTYKMILEDGREILLSRDHLNIVWKRHKGYMPGQTKGRKYYSPSGLEEVVMDTQELINADIKSYRTITDKQRRGWNPKFYIPRMTKPIEYNLVDTPIDPYTIGLILGDGSIDKKTGYVRITAHEDDFETYKKEIPYKLGKIYRKTGQEHIIFVGILGIGPDVKKYIGCETVHNKRIPSDLLHGSVDQRIALLQGLMDTDGTINKKGTMSFTTTSIGLAQDMQQLVWSLGGKAPLVERRTESTFGVAYTVTVGLNNIQVFKLPRKLERMTYVPARDCSAIVSLEVVHTVPMQCITVEDESASFVLDNGVVTHNSTIVTYIVLYMAAKGELPGFGKINYALYVSDSIRNGVETMMKTLSKVYAESVYLRSLFEETRLIATEANFIRKPSTPKEIALYKEYTKNGEKPENVPGRMKRTFTIKGVGANSGTRGPLALDELLYTDNGAVTMRDVAVNDYVFTPKGTLSKVIGKSEVFNDDMYEIEYSDGRKLKVNHSHINVVWFPKKKTGKYVKEHIITTDLISKFESGTKAYTKYTDPIQYSKKDFKLDPYLLGISLGDGSFRKNRKGLQINGIDTHCEHYFNKLSHNYNISKFYYNDRSGQSMLRLSIHGTTDILHDLGLEGTTGEDKFIPDEYMYGSIEQRKELLAGLLDTDGACSVDKRYGKSKTEFSNISKNIAEGVVELARSLGYRAVLKVRHRPLPRKTLYRVNITSKINPFTLPEKANKFTVPNSNDFERIVSITKIPNEPSQCILLDDDEHEFVTTGYLPTHNTRDALARPQLAIFDDLVPSEADAASSTILENIESTIEGDVLPGMSNAGNKAILIGTPYSSSDPVYKRIEMQTWLPVVFPRGNDVPKDKDTFVSVWPDRHSYKNCRRDYINAVKASEAGDKSVMRRLMQEHYLRISSEDDKAIPDELLNTYDRKMLMTMLYEYTIIITTDFTTTSAAKSDFSGIAVWAISSNDDLYLLDLSLKKLELQEQYNALFRMISIWSKKGNHIEVGVEIDGQQKAHIFALKEMMLKKNLYFTFAKQKGAPVGREGILSKATGGNKFQRFQYMLPMFQNHKIYFPVELEDTPDMKELRKELAGVSYTGFKSLHDDGLDLISQIGLIDYITPSANTNTIVNKYDIDDVWGDMPDEDNNEYNSEVF